MRVLAILIIWLCLTAATWVQPICANLRLVKQGNNLLVVCPDPAQGMTIKDWFLLCAKTTATRTGQDVTVTCLEPK